jgi:hypothetical protein
VVAESVAHRLDRRTPMQHTDGDETGETSERKTVDLCQAQYRDKRCMRHRGHAGQHECPVWNRSEPVRWD